MAIEETPKVEGVVETPVDKQSNRMFSQSDYDKGIADALKKETEKFKDYDSIKQEFEKIKSERQKVEEAKLSEVEKANKQVKELTDKLTAIEAEKAMLSQTAIRAEVLSDAKYVGLPNAYRKLIVGNDADEIMKSAQSVYEEFIEDTKKMGVSIPAPMSPKASPQKRGPETQKEKIQGSLEKRLSELPWMNKQKVQ